MDLKKMMKILKISLLFLFIAICFEASSVIAQESNNVDGSIDETISDGVKELDKLKEQSRNRGDDIDPQDVDLKQAVDPGQRNISDQKAAEVAKDQDEAEEIIDQEENVEDDSQEIEDTDLTEDLTSNTLKEIEAQFRRPIYSSSGKRDPFRPFLQAPKEKARQQITKSTPPIKRFPLDQFRVVGIVWMEQDAKVMIVDPEKNTYFLGVDDEIGNKNGRIVEVRNNGLLVEETRIFEDVFGETKVEKKKSVLAFVEKEE